MRDFDEYLTGHVSRQLYHKRDTSTDPLEITTREVDEVQDGDIDGKMTG
jgi:hypothetical protein